MRVTRAVFAMLATTLIGLTLAVAGSSAANASTRSDFTPMKNCATYSSNKILTRAQVLTRAQSWVTARVPYSQSACYSNTYGSYRTDCSGFASMAWGLTYSRTTADIQGVTHVIARSSLAPGDALWRRDSSVQHMAIFVRWGTSGAAVVREEYATGHVAEQRTWSASKVSGFTALRYDNIRA